MQLFILLQVAKATQSYNDGALKVIYEPIQTNNAERKPIRITFDTSFADQGASDGMTCTFDGEQVYWKKQQYICKADDVATEDQIIALQDTLQNVKKFSILSRFRMY